MAATEDKQCIIWCPQEDAITKWNNAIKELMEWMKSEQLDPQLIKAITTGLQAWYNETAPPADSLATSQQLQHGWEMVLDGWLSLE